MANRNDGQITKLDQLQRETLSRSEIVKNSTSRREFLKDTGRVAAASALAGLMIPHVHAAENNTIQVALIGCGSRGTGAAANALGTASGPIKLVAMADVFENRLNGSYTQLKKIASNQVDVPRERRFIGFDGYRKAMDCLKAGDLVILATPPVFRWVHFGDAIAKGIHVFMEKPTTVDGPTTRKMLTLAEQATQKNIKVGVGLMCRHDTDRQELHDQIQAGKLGPIVAMRSYRLCGPIGSFASGPRPQGISELLYQIQRFHGFLWASGGCFSDFYVHQIDECCWMKDEWPVQAQGLGGRHFRGNAIDQNFDNYSIEYTFRDGVKLFFYGRSIAGCYGEHASYVHAAKGMAIVTNTGAGAGKCRYFDGQNNDNSKVVWKCSKYAVPTANVYRRETDKLVTPNTLQANLYQREFDKLVDAIRQDRPYNEAKIGAEVSLVSAMGRMAAHTGQVITYDQILHCDHEFAPNVDKLTMDSPAPLQAGPDGKYPVPQPGITTRREF
jgi:predicted dehydrogenase